MRRRCLLTGHDHDPVRLLKGLHKTSTRVFSFVASEIVHAVEIENGISKNGFAQEYPENGADLVLRRMGEIGMKQP